MIVDRVYRCSVCNIAKGETNKWFMVKFARKAYESIIIRAFPHPYSINQKDEEEWDAICGESCLARAISSNIPIPHEEKS